MSNISLKRLSEVRKRRAPLTCAGREDAGDDLADGIDEHGHPAPVREVVRVLVSTQHRDGARHGGAPASQTTSSTSSFIPMVFFRADLDDERRFDERDFVLDGLESGASSSAAR